MADRVFAVGVGIWVVWGIAVVVNVVLPDHEVPGTVNVVAPIVAGGMFGGGLLGGVMSRRRAQETDPDAD